MGTNFGRTPKGIGMLAAMIAVLIVSLLLLQVNSVFTMVGLFVCMLIGRAYVEEMKKFHNKAGNREALKQLKAGLEKGERMSAKMNKIMIWGFLAFIAIAIIVNVLRYLL